MENVYQLPAAHFMEFNINENTKKIIEYWKFKKKEKLI